MNSTAATVLVASMLIATPATAQSRVLAMDVLDRMPNQGDGPPAYRQDMQWLDPNGHSWQMRDLGQGHSIWLAQEPTGRVLDTIGGTKPAAAYGTLRLTSFYTGPALSVVNMTTRANLDVGFLPSGSLDELGLASFCAQSDCRVSKWFDQSGHGRDAVQTSPAAQPSIRLSHRVGRATSVLWDYEATSGASARVMILPPSLAIDSGNMAILWTGRFHNASMISPLVELGTDKEAYNFGYWDAHGDFYSGTPAHLSELPGHAAVTSAVGVISSSADSVITNYHNQQVTLGKLPSEPHRGGMIGQSNIYRQNGMMELSSLVIYDRSLTQLEQVVAQQALEENFAIAQQQQDVYVADGDSLTQGIASQYLQSYPWYMERQLPRGMMIYNAAWAAKTLGGSTGLISRYDGFTAKLFNSKAKRNIISMLGGTNDIQEGRDEADVFNLVKQYASIARKTGFKVIVATIIPRASFTTKMEATRLALNTMIRTKWKSFADGIADLAADPAFCSPNVTSSNIYVEDGIHLTDFGYQVLATDMSAAVSLLLE